MKHIGMSGQMSSVCAGACCMCVGASLAVLSGVWSSPVPASSSMLREAPVANVPHYEMRFVRAVIASPTDGDNILILESLEEDKQDNDVPDNIDERIIVNCEWNTQVTIDGTAASVDDLIKGDRVAAVYHVRGGGKRYMNSIVARRGR